MGTRSLTHIKSEHGKTLLTIYKQYDGYYEGLGLELAQFLSQEKLEYNGCGCLAAQIIKHIKDSFGNVYIFPANSKDCGEEYIYTILTSEKLNIEITAESIYNHELKFKGTPKEFIYKYENR